MPLTRLRWLILLLLFLSTAINYVDRQALSVLLPTLRNELGLTSADYGMITTLFLAAYTLSQLGSGLLVDRIGPRRGLAWSIALWSTAGMAHALARGAGGVAVFRFVLGLGEAGNWPAGGKAIAQWFPQQRRALVMGIFDSGSAVGAIVAPPLVALLALHQSWQAAFVLTGLGGFAWLAAWLWIYDEPAQHRWLAPADRALVATEMHASAATTPRKSGGALASLLGRRQMWGLMVTRMMATPVWWFYVFWLPDYLAQDRGFTLAEIGFFAWIPYLTVDLGKVTGGALSDRLLRNGASIAQARKGVMVAGAVAMAAGTLVAGAHTAATAMAWVSVATFGFGMWSANILALHADIFPAEKMGSALGLTGMAASLGGAVSTFAIGRLVDRAGYPPVFLGAGLAALLACLALFLWIGPVRDRSAAAIETRH